MYIRFSIVQKTTVDSSAGFNLEILGCYDQGKHVKRERNYVNLQHFLEVSPREETTGSVSE